MTGRTVTPIDVVRWAGHRYYVNGAGTAWSMFEAAARHWNVKYEGTTGSINTACQALRNGKVVISIQAPGLFTSGGHFIVLRTITPQGKILVSDPNGGNRYRWGMTLEQYLNKQWTPAQIDASSNLYWIFSSDLITGGDVATQVWRYLKSQGYSDTIAAAILGNMMVECGGMTFDLQWNIHGHYAGDTYYGLCQWNLRFTPSIDGKSVRGQLDHLMSTIQGEFRNFGFRYKNGITYTNFTRMTDVQEAAVAFAEVYERTGNESNYYQLRRQCAVRAYNRYHK